MTTELNTRPMLQGAIHDDKPISSPRFKSADLFQRSREIEIDHNGRIYRMRLTHLNKLILTA